MRVRNNYYNLIISFLLISCGNHSEQINDNKYRNPVPENLSSSGIVFVRELHNFGTLKAGEMVSFSFVFINNGKIPVTIKKVDTSCGCIRANYDRNEIGRGEKSAIEVIFNTSGEWGNQLKMIHVETSSGEKKELRISAYIENEKFNNLLNAQQ
jgi:hypothetical protein